MSSDSKPSPIAELTLSTGDGTPVRLQDFAGRFLVVQLLRYYG